MMGFMMVMKFIMESMMDFIMDFMMNFIMGSIMGIMMLAAGPGSKLTIFTDCPKADELFEELRQLFAGKFQDG